MGRRKTLITLVVIIFFVPIIYFVSKKISKFGEYNISIAVAPKDSKILLDDKKIIKPGEVDLSLGEHTIKISREGFSDKAKSFTVKKDDDNTVYISLVPSTPEGEEYISTHTAEFMEIDGLAGQEITKKSSMSSERNPIIKDLPVTDFPDFRIDYGLSKKYPKDETAIAVYVSADTPQGRQSALSQIKQMGYNPTDYEIIFQPLEPQL